MISLSIRSDASWLVMTLVSTSAVTVWMRKPSSRWMEVGALVISISARLDNGTCPPGTRTR